MKYAGTGTTPANFMDFSGSNGAVAPVNFATWQTSIGGDSNSSAGIAGTGDFTTAMFVDATAGDLHLIAGGNPLVTATGSPVAGVTVDYDGQPRSATMPNIGSDEPTANVAPTNISLSNLFLTENNESNATIGVLTATDADVSDTHTFTFAAGGVDNAAFSLAGNTLRINVATDFETQNS